MKQKRLGLWWIVFALALAGCDTVLQTQEPAAGVNLPPTLPAGAPTPGPSQQAGEIEVFFTNPKLPNASSFRGGLDEQIAASIDSARVSVDLAAHEFNLWSIRDALLAAHRRGVRVRVVAESNNLDEPEFAELQAAGIEILGDRREGLMHNKFLVIDGQEVWSGSVNYTVTDMYFNNNHLLHFYSTELAQNYTTEFEEMFVDDLFGPDVRASTPFPSLTVSGINLENYFSPDDGTLEHLVELVQQADESIYFLAFSFTSDELAAAIIARAEAGVQVAGVMESAQVESNSGGEYGRFQAAGLDVRLDGNRRNMHHKVLIIDGQIVAAGSFNFTFSASQRNDENTVILYDREIAQQFLQEFQQIYADGR